MPQNNPDTRYLYRDGKRLTSIASDAADIQKELMTLCCKCNHPELSLNLECECPCHLTSLTAGEIACHVFQMRKIKTKLGVVVGARLYDGSLQLRYENGSLSPEMKSTDVVALR